MLPGQLAEMKCVSFLHFIPVNFTSSNENMFFFYGFSLNDNNPIENTDVTTKSLRLLGFYSLHCRSYSSSPTQQIVTVSLISISQTCRPQRALKWWSSQRMPGVMSSHI